MLLQNNLQRQVSLKEFSTFGIGGDAEYFVIVNSEKELRDALLFAREKELRTFILGKGSNTLFDDRGFKGLVILNKAAHVEFYEDRVLATSGYSFSHLGTLTARRGLTGLEFAAGIPGSVGGAIYMNAGAGGSEVSKVIEKATFLDQNLDLCELRADELNFSYRTSIFQSMPATILSGVFLLRPCSFAKKKQTDLVNYRISTQPYKDKSVGCSFKNPPNQSAGQLIESCGLKDAHVGGAFVSSVHANFIVNKNNATSRDVLELIQIIKKEILNRHNIELECELRYIPYE